MITECNHLRQNKKAKICPDCWKENDYEALKKREQVYLEALESIANYPHGNLMLQKIAKAALKDVGKDAR